MSMKKFVLFSVFGVLALFAIGLSVACNQDVVGHEDNPVNTLIVPENPPKNFSVTGCKSSRTRDEAETRGMYDELIEYEARENSLLRITHTNTIFNCAVLQIYAEMTVNDHLYIIEEKSQEGTVSANCICPYDLGYDIGPLKEGDEYTVSIRRGKDEDSEVAKFIFTYSSTVKGQITREK